MANVKASLLGGCLAFDELDSGPEIDRAFAIGYRFLDVRTELWTGRFTRFKERKRKSLRAGARILGNAAPMILSELGLAGKGVTFVPALSSGETVASEDQVLPVIARLCAKRCGAGFALDLLRKNPHERLHGETRTAEERESILSSAGYTSGSVTTSSVVVVDDLITRGSTLCTIASAIKQRNPGATVYGLALARNDRHGYLMRLGHVYYTNDHIPSEWDEIWEEEDPQ